jgi:hypothetical protein
MYLTELLSRAVNAGKPSLVHPVTLKAVDISPCSGSQIKVGVCRATSERRWELSLYL